MIQQRKSEKGQALVLIVFAIIGMLALVGLAIDGGQAFSDRRQGQNAADSAALAAALTYQKNTGHTLTNVITNALAVAATNGYSSPNSVVTVTNTVDHTCPGTPGQLFTVTIISTVKTSFAPVVGVQEVKNTVTATSRACPSNWTSPFPGDAVVGLCTTGNCFDSGNSNAADWTLTGGGIFSNDDAYSKNSDSVTFNTPDACIHAVGTESGFDCSPKIVNDPTIKIDYPNDIASMLPTIPDCLGGPVTESGDGKIHEAAGYEGKGTKVNGLEHDYAPGLYCITGLSGMITYHGATTGSGVTFYIMSTNFTVKFDGGGYIGATAPTSGTYRGVLMFSNVTTNPCSQNIEFRGNGSAANVGTIFLPSACIDFRGNSDGNLQRTQLIGYNVTSNGNASVAVNFTPDENYKKLFPNSLELIK